MFLIDKYAINDLSDIIFHKDIYKKILGIDHYYTYLDTKVCELESIELQLKNKKSYDNMPNLLLFGPIGSGKKSIINIVLKTIYGKSYLNTKELNYTISGYGNSNITVGIEQSNYHIVINPTKSGFDKYLIQNIVKQYAKTIMFTNKNFIKIKQKFKTVVIKNVDNLSYFIPNEFDFGNGSDDLFGTSAKKSTT